MNDDRFEVVFRADASVATGNGHVMRCLALADRLHLSHYRCHFICLDQEGHLASLVAEHGHTVSLLPASGSDCGAPRHASSGSDWPRDAEQSIAVLQPLSPRWLVVDHYGLDARWEHAVAPYCANVMAIDDLADRPHACNLLLDQSPGREQRHYAQLVPEGCELALGPGYALLRPQFARARTRSLARRQQPELRHILVSMGGADKYNATQRVLEQLDDVGLPDEARITVVLGRHSPYLAQVREQAGRNSVSTQVIVDARDMAGLLSEADVAIGGGGITAWERCCLGVPSLVVVLADNQRDVARELDRLGAAESIGEVDDLDTRLGPALQRLRNPATLLAMSAAASSIVDGLGTDRVAGKLEATDG